MRLPAALLALLALVIPASSLQLSLGEQRYSGQEHLVDAGSLGLPPTGLIAAFGDFNADQLLDLVHLSHDQRELVVYLWDRTAYSWKERTASRIRTPSDFVIVNVVPGDYDYDGRLDLLVMGESDPGGWWGTGNKLQMKVYLQLADGTFGESMNVDSSSLAHPIPFDATGDMRTDLLGFIPNPNDQHSLLPQLWSNTYESTNHTEIFTLSDPPLDFASHPCTFPTPHQNAFIDLDGDCLADLFFTCKGEGKDDLNYQIWVNDKKGGFTWSKEGKLPTGTKSVGFADMDRDGTIDLVMTACPTASTCSLSIAYNSQMPLCAKTSSLPCRDPEALCVADKDFSFNFSQDAGNADFTTIPISALFPSHSLVTESTAFRGTLPTPPAIGDFNIDGYPDLLLITSASSTHRQAHILESRSCDKASCTPGEVAKGRRAVREKVEGAEALRGFKDVESVAWMDMDDDGSLDIVVQRSGGTGGGAARKVVFIKNNYFHDAFFLKALVLNGACTGWCEPKETGGARYRPYGVSYSGASYKFTVLDPTGSRKATQVGQLPQSAYLALGTPYSYFGLGRTNNYVENLFVGSTRQQPQHFINVEGLIPNSQVVIDPWQPAGRFDPTSWTRELYLHPGDWIPWVTVVLTAAICAMGVVVLVLHFKEKREDELERRARLLSLNFQAL